MNTMIMMMTTMIWLLMLVIIPADASVNLTEGRAQLKEGWFDPKYKRQSLDSEERYFFEQVDHLPS